MITTADLTDIRTVIGDWKEYFGCAISNEMFARIYYANESRDPQSFFVEKDNGRTVGFCIGIKRRVPYLDRGLEKDKAFLLAIGVLKEYRNRGIGTALLKKFEQYYADNSETIVVGQFSPYYFFPAVEEDTDAYHLFLANDYSSYDRCFGMHKDLTDYRIPEDICRFQQKRENEGFRFLQYSQQHAIELLQFVESNFTAGWYYSICSAVLNQRAERTVLLAMKDDHIIGYIQREFDYDPNRFGPFGVAEEYRCKGIGTILLHNCWQSMTQEGKKSAYFKTTDEIAQKFYLRNGMTTDKTMWHMKKESGKDR